jgi:hypothetical protein
VTVVAADGGALKMLCWSSVAVTAPTAAAGLWNVPSSFAIVSDFDFAYCICCAELLDRLEGGLTGCCERTTYHLHAEEFKSLQRPHSLCRRLYVSEDYMCLTTHLLSLECYDIEDRTIGGEKHVERKTQVIFSDLCRGKVGYIEA